MAAEINAIGTRHWGRRNEFVERDTCEGCGKAGDLTSYDAMLTFVFFYYPLFPLRQERVLRKCPHCGHSRSLSLKVWNEDRDANLGKILRELKDNPEDERLAAKALKLCMAYQSPEHFDQVLPLVRDGHGQSSEVQLTLGKAHEHFLRGPEAGPFYRRAVELRDVPKTRGALAAYLLRHGKPDEAAPLLEDLFEFPDEDCFGDLLLLVHGYEATGEHDKAQKLIARLEKTYTESAETDPDFAETKMRLDENAGTNRKFVVPELKPPRQPGRPTPAPLYHFPRYAVLLLALLILGVCAWTDYNARYDRDLYVVNGLNTPYDVTIGEETKTIPAFGSQVFSVDEGEHNYSAEGEGLELKSGRFTMETPLFARVFNRDVFVLNPDRVAILAIDEDPDEPGDITYSSGELLSHFSGSDAPRLNVVSENNAEDYQKFWKSNQLDTQEIELRILAVQPGNTDVLSNLLTTLPPGEFGELVQSRLEDEPLRLEWHRLYQEHLKRSMTGGEIAKIYRELLDEKPGDPVRQYLLARVTANKDTALKLLMGSISAPNPPARAYAALAYYHLSRAEYDLATPYAERAAEMNPEFYDILVAAHGGMQDWPWMEDYWRKVLKRHPDNLNVAGSLVRTLVLEGKQEEARGVIRDFLTRNQRQIPKHEVQAIQDFLEAQIAYALGDTEQFLELAGQIEHPAWKFATAVTTGQLEEARQLLDQSGYDHINMLLLFYALAKQSGDEALARNIFANCRELLRGSPEASGREILDLFGEKTPTLDEVKSLLIMPEDKVYVVTALAYAHPELRPRLLPFARKLNYWRYFPYLTIEELLAAPGGNG